MASPQTHCSAGALLVLQGFFDEEGDSPIEKAVSALDRALWADQLHEVFQIGAMAGGMHANSTRGLERKVLEDTGNALDLLRRGRVAESCALLTAVYQGEARQILPWAQPIRAAAIGMISTIGVLLRE